MVRTLIINNISADIVDSYDDIVCNYPVLNDFFYNLIKNHTINYHFANCGTFDERYNDNINNLLQIQGIYNTNIKNTYSNYISNKNLFKDNLYNKYEINFLIILI